MASLLEEDEDQPLLMMKENDKAQKTDTFRNHKRHMSLVSLSLCRSMVDMRCVVQPL